ncbi:hypothetical protein DUHN55_14850 [Helicobacter pylori]
MFIFDTDDGGNSFGRSGIWIGHYGACLVLAEQARARHRFPFWKRTISSSSDAGVWIARSEGFGCSQELDSVFDSVQDLQRELDRLGAVEYVRWDTDLADSYCRAFRSKRLRKEIISRADA